MNTFDNFFILFTEDELHIGRRRIPLGQISTEILNWDDETFESLATATERFYACAMRLFQMKDKQYILDAQKSANAVFDIVLKLPPYCYIPMDMDLHYNIFTYLYLHTDQWDEAMTEGTTGRKLFLDMFENVRRLPETLKTFRSDVSDMLDNYFENLPSRTKREYGAAFMRYYKDMTLSREPGYSGESFEQSFPAHVNFVPLETEDGIVVAEETNFGELPAFLYTDLYRGIIHGNIPRRCHNCGRYFLLTNGYDTRYCNNIAPGETERTCRKIGAHVKEQAKHDKMANTPEGKEYLRTYRRLQARRKYGTISTDEWNAQVAEAQSILDRARGGELTEQEMRAAFNAIGGEKRKWARKSGSGS